MAMQEENIRTYIHIYVYLILLKFVSLHYSIYKIFSTEVHIYNSYIYIGGTRSKIFLLIGVCN